MFRLYSWWSEEQEQLAFVEWYISDGKFISTGALLYQGRQYRERKFLSQPLSELLEADRLRVVDSPTGFGLTLSERWFLVQCNL